MRFAEVLAAVMMIRGRDNRGAVSVPLEDLVEWVTDLEQAIILLRSATDGKGTDWKPARIALLDKYRDLVVH